MDYKKNIQRYAKKADLEPTRDSIRSEHPGVAIPVNETIVGKNRILNTDRARSILEKSAAFALLHCACRLNHENRCDAPLHACILLNDCAEGFLTKDKANHRREPERITLDKAIAVLTETHNAGLVHMAYNMNTDTDPRDFTAICSCCICCCYRLQPMLTYAPHLLEREAMSVVDNTRCVGCGKCVERCQFGAKELIDGTIAVEESRCFGCGVCVTTCPEHAISLVPVPS